jgi:hypothetical protein
LSHQCAQILLNIGEYKDEKIEFPDQPLCFSNRQIWLITETVRVLQNIKLQSGAEKFSWCGLIDSFDHNRANKSKIEFWAWLQKNYPEFKLGEFSEDEFAKLIVKTLPNYFAQYWVLMTPRPMYFSYDIFGYITNVEINAYFSSVSVEKRTYRIWDEEMDFNLVHICENLSLEGLNTEASNFFPSYAFAYGQTMFLDDRTFYKIVQNSLLVNEYKFQITKKDKNTYLKKMTGNITRDIDPIKRVWAIEDGNYLYEQNEYGDMYNQVLENVIAHEASHIYDTRHNLAESLVLYWPNTLHKADMNCLTFSVQTEFNAFASEIINSKSYKATLAQLLSYTQEPKVPGNIGYPHAIARYRFNCHLMGETNGDTTNKVLAFSKFFHQPDEYIKNTHEMKRIFEKERGEKYYYRYIGYFLLQYTIFIIPIIYIMIMYIAYRKYILNK